MELLFEVLYFIFGQFMFTRVHACMLTILVFVKTTVQLSLRNVSKMNELHNDGIHVKSFRNGARKVHTVGHQCPLTLSPGHRIPQFSMIISFLGLPLELKNMVPKLLPRLAGGFLYA